MRPLLLVLLLLIPSCASRSAPVPDRWDYQRSRYNRIYSDPNQAAHADHPSQFLLDCLSSSPARPSASALDIGAGQGRNAIPLAERGNTVTAVDISSEGLAHIRRRASERRLRITTVEADIHTLSLAPSSIDLAIAIYFPVSESLATSLAEAIRPGGAIIIEGYPTQCPLPVLERHFAGWHICRSETVQVVPDWHWGKDRKAVPVAHFFARKPRVRQPPASSKPRP